MLESTKKLFDAAKNLPALERLALIDQVLDSLDTPDTSIDNLWAKEAEV